ncbi:uncharacterized protein LOC131675550 [Phymastichus coffea]|uniref:uncharacterized protein LOC131675550 n=1 Tax=Phymastichus coffea TaxID=108790 RepID=UPI00273B247A|nr:uncharacterized protein LOC131675550 [Phymastichus coffea]
MVCAPSGMKTRASYRNQTRVQADGTIFAGLISSEQQELEEGEVIDEVQIEDSDQEKNSEQRTDPAITMTRGFGPTTSTPKPMNQVNSNVTIGVSSSQCDRQVSNTTLTDLITKTIEKSLKLNSTVNNVTRSGDNSISIDFNHNESNVLRRYTLTKKTRYETFENYLFTELKAKRLFYVLNDSDRKEVDELKLESDDVKVKDIIINHIHEEYNDRFSHISNPIDLIKEIKKIKLQEIRLTKHVAYKNLINIKYDCNKETGFDFCARFDNTVRIYEAHIQGKKVSEDEQRSLFINAVRRTVRDVVTADCMRETEGKNTFDLAKLRCLFLQHAPRKTGHHKDLPNAMNTRPDRERPAHNLCFNCGSNGHHKKNCKTPAGTLFCYKCQQPGHIQRECTSGEPGLSFVNTKRQRENETSNDRLDKRPRYDNDRSKHSSSEPGNLYSGQSGRGRGGSSGSARGGRQNSSFSTQQRKSNQGKQTKKKSSKRHSAHCCECDVSESEVESDKESDNVALADSGARSGNVELVLKDGKRVILDKVIYAKDLAKNLISLRRFADKGLKIYLDNKRINIYDPKSRQTVISGLYKRPFWEISLDMSGVNNNSETNSKSNSVFVNICKLNSESFQSKKETVVANITTRRGTVTQGKPMPERIEKEHSNVNNRLLCTLLDRQVVKASNSTYDKLKGTKATEIERLKKLNTVMLWHTRLAHMSAKYLKEYTKAHPEIKDFSKCDFDEGLKECDVCFRAKMNKLPFRKIRDRENAPLLRIHAEMMGYITPVTYPKQYRFIVAFVDSYSRFAMTYALRHKSDVPGKLKEFIISARNLLRTDAKFCYLSCDQGTEFTGTETLKVLKEFGAELQAVCPGTPEHNGVVERFNQTITKRLRALLLDSGFPLSMWDLALGVATYVYNQSPHSTINMKSPLSLFAPNHKINANQLKRFGCLTYALVSDGKKLDDRAIQTYLIGYLPTGYIVFDSDTKKLIETREVRFVERYTYGDKHKNDKENIENLIIERNDPIKEKEKETEEISETEGVTESTPKRRKVGRHRKTQTVEPVVLYALNNSSGETENDRDCDIKYHALLAGIMQDPKSYREAMARPDRAEWKIAFDTEIDAMIKNNVLELYKRADIATTTARPNIIDTRWVCKTKINVDGTKLKRTRLVARGFRDKNFYDLRETYAPVTRLPLIRMMFSYADKHDLIMYQMDVKTAFLNSDVIGEVYIEIPDGFPSADKERKEYIYKLKKSLYGLKTSPKSWYELFANTMKDFNFKTTRNEPCLFVYIVDSVLIVLLLYVDDIIMIGNNQKALDELKIKLAEKFEMKDLGEPRKYLGITITRDRQTKTIELNQSKFIDRMLEKFGYKDAHPQNSPMVTSQVNNRERRERENEEMTYSVNELSEYSRQNARYMMTDEEYQRVLNDRAERFNLNAQTESKLATEYRYPETAPVPHAHRPTRTEGYATEWYNRNQTAQDEDESWD